MSTLMLRSKSRSAIAKNSLSYRFWSASSARNPSDAKRTSARPGVESRLMRGDWILCRLAVLATLCCATALPQTNAVEFNRDIRPILSDRCYACHGPDQGKRISTLPLHTEAGAKSDLGGHFAIVPGSAANSELIRRVTSDDLARRMPPAYSGAARLTDREIGLLTRWIAQGAPWQKHWSFIPPVRPVLPEVHGLTWPKNAIDHFVMARLEREGLRPSI